MNPLAHSKISFEIKGFSFHGQQFGNGKTRLNPSWTQALLTLGTAPVVMLLTVTTPFVQNETIEKVKRETSETRRAKRQHNTQDDESR